MDADAAQLEGQKENSIIEVRYLIKDAEIKIYDVWGEMNSGRFYDVSESLEAEIKVFLESEAKKTGLLKTQKWKKITNFGLN